MRLSDSEVRAHIVLGRIHLFHNQFEQAKAEMERAIAINPSDAHGLAGRGNILMWLGQPDAAIESLELAQRIDPELNAIDRFALSMAYYLKRRYDAAIEQAQLNLRNSESSYFSHVVLAAAYAQHNRSEDAARVVAEIRRTDPTFDPQVFGTKFLNRRTSSTCATACARPGSPSANGPQRLANDPLTLLNEPAVLVGLGEFSARSRWKQSRPDRLAEEIELALADKPILRVAFVKSRPE